MSAHLLLPLLLLHQATPSGSRVELQSPAGKIEVRPLVGFDTDDPRKLGAWIVRYQGLPATPQLPVSAENATLELSTGEHLVGRVRGGRAELLDVEIAGGVHVGVAVDELQSLVFPDRLPALWTTPIAPAKAGDRLYRRKGDGLDTIDGGVEEFTTDGVRFHGEQIGSKLVPWSDVAALYVEALASQALDKGKGLVPVVIDLLDQSRVRGNLERLTTEGCRLATRNGERILLPAAAIATVLVDDGKVAYLSSLPSSRAEPSAPFGDDLGMRWVTRIDRSVGGGPLRAGGRSWPRGIGVHAPSVTAWRLDGAWKELRGTVAVDDDVLRLAARGSVVFRVKVDGKVRWESPVLRAGDPPAVIPAQDLAGAAEIALEVDAATDSFVADRADWLDMILVR